MQFFQTHDNNNNNHENVYGAVIMTKVTARVHPVHSMSTDWVPADSQPPTKTVDLGCESTENWLLPELHLMYTHVATHKLHNHPCFHMLWWNS